jgi:hypothetical protein
VPVLVPLVVAFSASVSTNGTVAPRPGTSNGDSPAATAGEAVVAMTAVTEAAAVRRARDR